MHLPQPESDNSLAAEKIIVAAGEWLVSLCSKKDTDDPARALTLLEQEKFDEFFVLHRRSLVFQRYHVDAVRRCLAKEWNPDYRLTRELLDKDDTHLLFTNETDVLQVAIKAARIQPGLLGRPPKESCPELLPMVKALIGHGASVNCLDGDGNSALFYACVLGHGELFRFLVASGAPISTSHRRSRPDQLCPGEQACLEQEEDSKANLLQITLDALISPQRIVNMTWVGWPPGVDYDRPLWKLELDSTCGGIILHLLQEGLTYAKDDPGLVMILHIACYQGALDYVLQLLDFGVVTNVAGPRIVDGGQGRGSTFGTALHAAAAQWQLQVATLVMARGESPRIRQPCIFNRGRTTADLTPVEVAIASEPYAPDRTDALLTFLDALMQDAEGLKQSDHQAMMVFGASGNHVDFTRRLLQRGVRPPETLDIGSLEMARLLVSYGVVLDPVAMQKTALSRKQLDLLRWCVGEYGPKLPSDPESWGEMALRMLQLGNMYIENLQYLVSEYPGLHIDAVLSAVLQLPGQQPKPTPTSWLHMAAFNNNLKALRLLLEAGADPACPGLAFDVATTIRKSNHYLFRDIDQRLEVVWMLESTGSETGTCSPASYAELKSRRAGTISKQRQVWDARVMELVQSRRNVPLTRVPQNHAPTQVNKDAANNNLVYRPLSSKSSFRLLELLPSSNRTVPLAGCLVDSDVTFQPDYEALSYVWGNTSSSENIFLDGQAVAITPNLHSALIHLRHSNNVRTLWVDALCVDQLNQSERNQQVMIMGDIYQSARQVVVWLGEAADNSHLVFAHLKDDTKHAFPNCPTPPAPQRRAWKALVSRPWFFRTWVIQEVALNKRKATIVCGEDSALWIDLSSGAARDISGGAHGLSSISSAPGNKPDHPLAGFDADCHVWRLRLLKAGDDPIDILRYSRVCQTSEVKDRVYGILGLFEPGFISVDYRLPAEVIFRQFTEAVIQLTGNLRVLTCLGVGPHTDSLPSWVPDFMNTTAVGSLPQHYWDPPYRDGGQISCYTLRTGDGTESSVVADDFPQKALPGLAFPASGALAIRGKLVDTIRVLGPTLPAEVACAPGTVAFSCVIQAWESLAAALVCGWWKGKRPPPKFAPALPSITSAFAATLVASYGKELYSIDIGFAEWYRHCGTGVLEAADSVMFLRDREFYLWWLKGMERDDDASNAGGEARGEGVDSGDTVPRSDSSTRCSSSSSSQELGYELCKFAEQMELACYGRRFFTTNGGSMGLAGPRARVGDRIALIPGGDQPFVLRPRDDRTGWTMANDCYLYGLDPYALFEDDRHVVEEFVIL